jgi:hypothetical protein
MLEFMMLPREICNLYKISWWMSEFMIDSERNLNFLKKVKTEVGLFKMKKKLMAKKQE